MLTVSNELKNAFMKDERTIFVRIKIGNRVFDNDNVISVDYDAGSLSGEVFAIGSTYSNSIKITFSELVEGLKELDEVTYEIGIKLANGTIEYVPMGVFVINDAIEMDRNNNKTTIECMDRMVMMGGAYASSLTYPAAIREVALEIANKAGIEVADTFDRLSAYVISKPEGYTYREAIGLIAQFEAGFATFNRYGKLEIRTLSDPNFAIPPDNYFSKGLVKNEVFFRLGGISCTTDDSDTVIQSGNKAGNQVILENRVMTKTLLDKIYQRIQTINYYPFSLSWQGNPVLEAGDWVEVEDLKGNKFKTPNLSYSLSFNGGLSAKSSAETVTQSDATYQYKSPLQQKIEWIHARIDAAGGNVVYEGVDEPANPKEGDLWFKIIGPDKEILIYKKHADGSLFWEPHISTADIDKVAKEVEAIIKQADADREATEQKLDQAVADAKAYTEKKANEFDTKFETETGAIRNEVAAGYTNAITVGKDYTDVKSAEFDAQLIVVKNDLVNTVLKADAAVLKADKTIEDAGFMQVDVDAAKQNSITALTTAQNSYDEAVKALNKATSVESITNTLSLNYDTLTKTVGLKVDKEVVNGISQTVDKHTLDIKANADGLKFKAEANLVNTIKQTVDSHSNEISANAQAISARVTSAQVDSLVSGKNYVNQTTLNATANGLRTDITKVSSDLSNLDISDRNLIRNGSFENGLDYWSRSGVEVVSADATVYEGDKSVRILQKDSTVNNFPGIWQDVSVREGEEYTLSFAYCSMGDSTNDQGFFARLTWINSDGVNIGTKDLNIEKASPYMFRVSSISATAPVGAVRCVIRINYRRNGGGYIDAVKFQKGNKVTPYSPAYEDMATVEQFTTIDATVKGLQTTVGNKAEQSQITQLAGQITSVVKNVDDLQFNGTNIVKNSETWLMNSNNNSTYPILLENITDGGINFTRIKPHATVGDGRLSLYETLRGTDITDKNWKGRDIVFSIRIRSSAVGRELTISPYVQTNGTTVNGTIDRIVTTGNWQVVKTVFQNFSYQIDNSDVIRFMVNMGTNMRGYQLDVRGYQIEFGNKASIDWSPSNADLATQTQITQLTTDINLRATKAGLMAQINLNPEGVLLQGRNIRLDGDVSMSDLFVTNIKSFSIDAVYADIATLKTKVLTTDVITSIHLKVDNALIDKLTVNVAVVNYLFTKQAIIDNLKVKSLEAIYADIATLKTKLLTADVITSVHIKSDTALIDKLFVTDANINRLTAKSAFINSVKAIDIAADRITAGTLNAALVNIINLNANRIATGTITGANSDWNLNTGIQTFRNPSTGDNLILSQGAIQFQNGGQIRLLEYTAEGLKLSAGPGNTGTSLNASLHLNGGVSYVQFNNRAGTVNNGRIQMTSDSATIQIPNGAFLAIRDRNNLQAGISVNYVTTEHNTGYTIQMAGDSIKTPRAGNRNIYIAPNGTGSVVAGEANGGRYNMVASDFVKQSSRSTKTNIIPLESGLDNIRQLKPVSYNKIDKLNQGIFEIEKGFIAEDSLMVATVDGKGIYDSHITAYLVKAVQEVDRKIITEVDLLKAEVNKLKQKIEKLESAA